MPLPVLPEKYEKPDWDRGVPLYRPDGSIWHYRKEEQPENYDLEMREGGPWFVWRGGEHIPVTRRLYRRLLQRAHELARRIPLYVEKLKPYVG